MASKSSRLAILAAGLGGAAYLLFGSKKASAATGTTKPTDKPKEETPKPVPQPKPVPKPKPQPEPDDDLENLPPPPKEESPDLPDLDETPPDQDDIDNAPKTGDAEGNVKITPNMDQFYQKWLRTGNEVPAQPVDPFKLWISDTCESWGVGKNWSPILMAKYVIPEEMLDLKNIDPNEMMLPTDYWDVVGGNITPDPVYVNNLGGDVPYFQWARNLLALYAPQCWDLIPKRKNYPLDGFKEYQDALKAFSQTKFGQLFKFLADDIRQKMYDHWAQQYPEEADTENRRGWALAMVRQYPKYSATEQTDQAYKKYFEGDPKAPKKLNPNLPSHKPYVTAWKDLNQWVKSYRDLISDFG